MHSVQAYMGLETSEKNISVILLMNKKLHISIKTNIYISFKINTNLFMNIKRLLLLLLYSQRICKYFLSFQLFENY